MESAKLNYGIDLVLKSILGVRKLYTFSSIFTKG